MNPVGENAEDEEEAEEGVQLAVGQQSHHHVPVHRGTIGYGTIATISWYRYGTYLRPEQLSPMFNALKVTALDF